MNDASADAKPTILVVEDEVPIQTIVRTVLEMNAYEVWTVGDGDAALQLSRQHSGNIDLVITDMNLPGMTGAALVRQLLVGRPSMHVLYISGYLGGEAPLVGGTGGTMKFLSKPFTPKNLLASVRSILAAPHVS